MMDTRYRLVTQNMNWTEAGLYCQSQYRAHMVIIDSAEDQLNLQYYIETLDGWYRTNV